MKNETHQIHIKKKIFSERKRLFFDRNNLLKIMLKNGNRFNHLNQCILFMSMIFIQMIKFFAQVCTGIAQVSKNANLCT